MRNQKGFIQIPLLIGIIVSIVIVSVGTIAVLHKQEKLVPLIANISGAFKEDEKPDVSDVIEYEEPLTEELSIETPEIEATEISQESQEKQVATEQKKVEERIEEVKEELEEKAEVVEDEKVAPKEVGIPTEDIYQETQEEQEEIIEEMDGTEVQGFISSNTVWTLKDSPFIVTDDVLIKRGVTLTIEPGVVVKFQKGQGRTNTGGFAILNGGNIIARGNPTNKIVFTSLRTNPQLGDWGTIEIINGGSIDFNSVEIKYASLGVRSHNASNVVITNSYFYNNGTAIFINKGPAIISNNLIEKNYAGISFMNIPYSGSFDDGSFRYQGTPKTQITNNTIQNNIGQSFNYYHAGVRLEMNAFIYILEIYNNDIRGNSQGITIRETGGINPSVHGIPRVSQNNIYDNKGYALHLSGESDITIDVSNNWWGTTDTKKIDELIYDYYDSWRPGIIDYQPIATSKIPNAGAQ